MYVVEVGSTGTSMEVMRNYKLIKRVISLAQLVALDTPGKTNLPAWRSCCQVHCSQPKATSYPIIMKLESPQFKSLFTDEVKQLQNLFDLHGFELRLAGGAVRDLLLGQQPKDLDFATTATPEQMKEIFTKHNVRMINTNGEKHGTITPRINEKENFEVTTLRVDMVTDGRHAQVKFTTDWMLDAERRDLTINSMFLGLDGTVYDYFGGYQDLINKRILFVGDPTKRIQEDYLRILRYFRFYGRIADSPNEHNAATLEALRENSPGLRGISGERVWTELSKILTGRYAGEVLETMLSLQLAAHIGLPTSVNLDRFRRVWHALQQQQSYHAITLLCGLFSSQEDLLRFHARVKLSSFERELGLFIVNNRENKPHPQPLKPYQCLVFQSKGKASDNIVHYVEQVFAYRGDASLLQQWQQWTIPKMPVNGTMLQHIGVKGGKQVGLVLNGLRDLWIESDFTLSAEQLLHEVPRVLDTLKAKVNNKPKDFG